VMKLADVLTRKYDLGDGVPRKVAMVFIDSAGTCGNICRKLRAMGHHNVTEINFGGHAPDKQYKLMRSYMWCQIKENLAFTAIDASPDLEADLQTPGYKLTRHSEILPEEKQASIKPLGQSTDDGDSLGLAYAVEVPDIEQPKVFEPEHQPIGGYGGMGWMR